MTTNINPYSISDVVDVVREYWIILEEEIGIRDRKILRLVSARELGSEGS